MFTRRNVLIGASASTVIAGCGSPAAPAGDANTLKKFPEGFFWGASTAGHQIEGQNIHSDLWYLELLPETAFQDPSGQGVNSFNLWETDLDIVKAIGLDTYRFSIEWARIEPEEGVFSDEALAHYRRILEGSKARGLKSLVTFNHFTSPLWFAADGGWTNPKAPARFTKYCDIVASALGDEMDYALTFNEPQIVPLIRRLGIPDFIVKKQEAMLAAAEVDLGVPHFSSLNVSRYSDIEQMQTLLIEGHVAARETIKSRTPDLPLGVSIAIFDDQEGEPGSIREEVREELYGPWLRIAKGDDFLGIQNYERMIWGKDGKIDPPADSPLRNFMDHEVYAPSLAGAVRYGHEMTGLPIIVTEHGVGTADDTIRDAFIPQSLAHLHSAIEEGVPVLGYCHWSLLDNFEWVFGYGPKFGLVSVDRSNFERTPKPSAATYGKIAKSNSLTTELMKEPI